MGMKAYLTSARAQELAPSFDDFDAFVRQLHGCKTWRVYAHILHYVLPRV